MYLQCFFIIWGFEKVQAQLITYQDFKSHEINTI